MVIDIFKWYLTIGILLAFFGTRHIKELVDIAVSIIPIKIQRWLNTGGKAACVMLIIMFLWVYVGYLYIRIKINQKRYF